MKNKITIETTADGWKTDVTVDGKTYTEHHEMSDEGCTAKCMEGNLETAGIPDPIVDALDGFSASTVYRHFVSVGNKQSRETLRVRELRKNCVYLDNQ